MNYIETMEYINSFTKSGKPVTDLSRIRKLLNMLGNPQNDLKFIHIAGTNGKGSTVEMLSNVLRLSNYKVGSFTSPYMVCYEDRIRLNGENIPKGILCDIAQTVKNSVDNTEFSQFEISMAIAFIYFKSQNCDIVVLETGIGGLVDSTNIIENPLVSVITSISLDHTAILGNTLQKIAIQKSGIIKPNRPIVLSADNVDNSVIEVVSKTATEKNSPLIIPNNAEIIKMDLNGTQFKYLGQFYTLKMLGKHQVVNATTVIEVCNILNNIGYRIPIESIRKSLETTQVRFRTETIQDGNLTIIADGSHNIGGVLALKDTLKSCNICNPTVLTGMISTKDYLSCCEVINSFAMSVICTDGFIYNAIDKNTLSENFHNTKVYTSELKSALNFAKGIAIKNGTPLVVCGSLYMLTRIFE